MWLCYMSESPTAKEDITNSTDAFLGMSEAHGCLAVGVWASQQSFSLYPTCLYAVVAEPGEKWGAARPGKEMGPRRWAGCPGGEVPTPSARLTIAAGLACLVAPVSIGWSPWCAASNRLVR